MPAEKRNIASRVARGKYLAIFDDDVEITPGCIEEMYKFLEANSNAGMVYGKLMKFDEQHRFDEAGGFLTSTGFIWSRAGQNIEDTGQYDTPEKIFAGKSASCMVRTSLWKRLGGMDEDFEILGEESDISWRIWLYGFEVWWVPSSVALHKFNTPLKPANKYYTSTRVNYNGARNYATMLIKNLGACHLWIVPLHMSIWFIVGLALIGTGKIEPGWNIVKGLGSVLRNARKIGRKRREIQEWRKVSEEALWPIISRKNPKGYYSQRLFRYLKIGLHG